jgi:hypothetical protein
MHYIVNIQVNIHNTQDKVLEFSIWIEFRNDNF